MSHNSEKNRTQEPRPPIAVVGMAGVFPGASDIDQFWHNIINKKNAVIEIPEERWIVPPDVVYSEAPLPDKSFSRRACLIRDFRFDSAGFSIDPELLEDLDPLYHLVLQAGKAAFSQVKPDHSSGKVTKKRTGTILAAIALPTDAASSIARKTLGFAFEERLLGKTHHQIIATDLLSRTEALAGRVTSFPATLLAKALQLGGGSYTLDAACASSLYAVKLACDELSARRADVMLAGGVSRPDSLYTQIGFTQLRALSPTGRCAPFDSRADGLVVGEGVGILALKRLQDALLDGDQIYGLIRGIGLSNDISGNLLTPASEGQIRAMHQAYAKAGLNPDDIDLIECHGTGTPVGDTTEIESLMQLWEHPNRTGRKCAIGSVKSMIGHLLTAAGAAGMIKTLLALKHGILPPSLNYVSPPAESPLNDSSFKVQTEAETWPKRNAQTPRRAAVSAFGFGGIDAHLIFEAFEPSAANSISSPTYTGRPTDAKSVPIAIVGMNTSFGSFESLGLFQEAIFNGDSSIRKNPAGGWKGSFDQADLYGGFMNRLEIPINAFHIPPKEIPDIIPQHLLALKVAAGAMKDSRLPLREKRPPCRVVIGMGFDFEATDFHLRWNLHNQIPGWIKQMGYHLNPRQTAIWLETLKDACGPPLTATRTLGALGGIIGSRIAKEFRLGGPSFVVSCEEASGLKALEIGVRSLQQSEAEAFLVGAVDFTGDARNIVVSDKIKPFTHAKKSFPFDKSANGALPGEGAAAIIIKRLDRALSDGDRIYAVIKGLGNATGGDLTSESTSPETYIRSLTNALQEAGISHDAISYVETHGSGDPQEDRTETEALHRVFKERTWPCALGALKPNIGHTGAASGLASLVKTALALYHEIIPPLINFTEPLMDIWKKDVFHIPAAAQYWYRDRRNGPRRACVSTMTSDGNCSHAVLEAFEYQGVEQIPNQVVSERHAPLGFRGWGLFVVEGFDRTQLLKGLKELALHVSESHRKHRISMAEEARTWFELRGADPEKKYAVTLMAGDIPGFKKGVVQAKAAVETGTRSKFEPSGGVCYSPEPLGGSADIAFVFPGSGNHYVGMGRTLGIRWPEIFRAMDIKTEQFMTQIRPHVFTPWRSSWEPGWQKDAHEKILCDPLNMIFQQVVYGGITANLVQSFGIRPRAVIGYSLGESTGLFALGAWPDRGEMLKRMLKTKIFHEDLSGPCDAVRKAWKVPESMDIGWRVVVVNRPAEMVRDAIADLPYVRLLIINTHAECVVGGIKEQVNEALRRLGGESVYLEGVVAVHCDALSPVVSEYRGLHVFQATNPEGIRFYSCASGQAYHVTDQAAAASIVDQALSGFDFPALIERTYNEGVRVFLEMGPHSSCSRMIDRILGSKPHLSVSASVKGEDEYRTWLRFLGTVITERIPVELDRLYGQNVSTLWGRDQITPPQEQTLTLAVGGITPIPDLPYPTFADDEPTSDPRPSSGNIPYSGTIETYRHQITRTAQAHQTFLQFSEDLGKAYERTFTFQNKLAGEMIRGPSRTPVQALYSREQCLEFAVGSAAAVLGSQFRVVDGYPVRVRLPDEPLMLVDRILSLQGKKCELGPGRIVTEHDVHADAWYLDGNRVPVCISVEAGQADLFLCSYLGIDRVVKGERAYRLLDATVIFHRDLPRPEDIIRYEIEIERFVQQGDTYLFFFHFEGFIGNSHLITMKNGCAGFFTEEEVRHSGGILSSEEEDGPKTVTTDPIREDIIPFYQNPQSESYSEEKLSALRRGDPAGCFGNLFKGITISDALILPSGRMKLIDRILTLDPTGGQYRLGLIRAEADIDPDAWFLTCHFVDDRVMPGTLMYECCAHTLRVFIQRMGWITDSPEATYEPVVGIEAVLKCRGPVTPQTTKVVYEIEIKKIGYDPHPFVIADAHMYADGHYIVCFSNMSLQLTGSSRNALESFWKHKGKTPSMPVAALPRPLSMSGTDSESPQPAVFDHTKLLEFALGKPSKAFGNRYRIFDKERFIARLPNPPYLFIDRITSLEPEAWVLKPDGWVEAEFDIDPDAWYFKANRTPSLPYCALNEIALQPCGWLAAYMGSALKSQKDLRFRNLDGRVILHDNIHSMSQTLTTRARLKKVSEAGDMIIEEFDFCVLTSGKPVYEGNTNFGFFTEKALEQQAGIRDAEKNMYAPASAELQESISDILEDKAPLSPHDKKWDQESGLAMPAKALRMVDKIDNWIPAGGPAGLGFIRATKRIHSGEWYFKAHFYQDPVCPGSLGLESFIQLLKYMALHQWPERSQTHRFELFTGQSHSWSYRGQILPHNEQVEIEAVVTSIGDSPVPYIQADGFLKVDGLCIYQFKNFGVMLTPF